jgi:hypothetical protein
VLDDDGGLGSRLLQAIAGLRGPLPDDDIAMTLIQNGSRETYAFGGWVVLWALTVGLLFLVGLLVRSVNQPLKGQIFTAAAILMATCATGAIIHVIRAAFALSAGRKLAVRQQAPGAYDGFIARLTAPTPWVLVPQILLGAVIAVFVSSQVSLT